MKKMLFLQSERMNCTKTENMRLYLRLSKNTEIVPYEYQQKLIGVIHNWLGDNDIHNGISLYSFSWLHNGTMVEGGYDFKHGARWMIGFYDAQYVKKLIAAILRNPVVISGMYVEDVVVEEPSGSREEGVFMLGSPVFIKRKTVEGKYKFYTFEDKESADLMKETLLHKMDVAGKERDKTLSIQFDLNYSKKKVKTATIHGIQNKCSMCPVIIKRKPETIDFALCVGIGNGTGSGFGAIY